MMMYERKSKPRRRKIGKRKLIICSKCQSKEFITIKDGDNRVRVCKKCMTKV